MMKKLIQLRTATSLLTLISSLLINAQQASMTIVGLSGQNMTFTGSTVYMPAGSYLNHTGSIYVAANQIVTGNTGTVITGSTGSRLVLLGTNQLDATAPAAATQLDGNGVAFDVNIVSVNPQKLSLTDLAFGTTVSDGSADFTVLREFAFAVLNPFTATPVNNNHLITNSNRFIVGASATLADADTNRHVVTNNNAGELRKLGLNNGQSFFFPIGRAEADYTPARIQVASGGAVDYFMNVRNFAESIPDENIGGYSSAPNVSRTWMIYGSNAATVANIDLIHPGTPTYEVNSYDRSNSNVIRFNGSGWVPNLPNNAENESLFGTPANYWAQQISFAVPSAIGANSFYGKSNSLVVLPLRLGDFTVKAFGCEAMLDWTTLMEQNLSHFNVERSYTSRANSWEVIAKIAAAGNSSTLRQYNNNDAKAISSEAFYRLSIIENDGRVSYSPTRWVSFNCNMGITGYPNPSHDYFTVLLPQGADKYTVRVINAIGQTALPVVIRASGNAILQTGGLTTGVYTVVVTDSAGKNTTLRMVKE